MKLHRETEKYWSDLVRTYRRDVRAGMSPTPAGLGLRDHWEQKVEYRTNDDGNDDGHVPRSSYAEFESYVMAHLKPKRGTRLAKKSRPSKPKKQKLTHRSIVAEMRRVKRRMLWLKIKERALRLLGR